MNERDLKKLKDMPVPEPRGGARAAALQAALDAYEGAAEIPPLPPKGNPPQRRRSHTQSNSVGRRMMRFSKRTYAAVASLAVIAIAVPAVVYLGQEEPVRQASTGGILDMFSGSGTEMRSSGGGMMSASENTSAPARSQPSEPKVVLLAPPSRPRAADVARPDTGRLASAQQGIARLTMRDPSAGRVSPHGFAAPAGLGMQVEPPRQLSPLQNRDRFEGEAPNSVKQVASEPVSTFSVDVDTSSYAFARRILNSGSLPSRDAVRVEELINYFSYDYPRPASANEPFKPTITVMPSPWNAGRQLVHVGLKGYELKAKERPRANLVFLVDVSGSMGSPDKLGLLKQGLLMFLEKLNPEDSVGIVTYASGSGVVLEPTRLAEKAKIQAAIERLGAGGSTAGAQGIHDAYRLAEQAFDKDAVNRVILGTDGDFNVGITDHGQLKSFIENKRKSGIFLSVLGFGQGNYNDALMQTLAQNGNGTAAYIDTLSEARKVLTEEASSTLFTIAKDVKIQIEFNPAQVSEYRLVGYETRALRREDFNNDAVDAGDVGSGHTVTAIYEITPAGAEQKSVDNLRYAQPAAVKPAAATTGTEGGDELAFFKLRYKLPNEDESRLISTPILATAALASVALAPEDVRFAVAVAGFGQRLRGDPWAAAVTYDDVIALARTSKGPDDFGLRAQFVELVRLAKVLTPSKKPAAATVDDKK